MTSGPKIAVIGAGISGLAFAHRLSELSRKSGTSCEIVIYDAKNRVGGNIETERRDGFILEKGPDAFITDKPWVLDLARRIGLESDLLGTQSAHRRSFIVKHGRLIPVPDGMYLISPVDPAAFLASPLVSWPGKLRMMAELWIPPKKEDGDESIAAFVRRRFGREALDRIAQAMLGGIYTGDPELLSLRSTLPRFLDLERQYGSVTRGLMKKNKRPASGLAQASGPRYSLFMSFKNGMQSLPEALGSRLPAEAFRLGRAVVEVGRENPSSRWRLKLEGDRFEEADVLCISSSARHAKTLLEKFEPDLAGDLAKIHFESVATINLAYRKIDIRHPLNGFGFVVPKVENKTVIACSFSSQKFLGRAPKDRVLLRAFVGGAFGRTHFKKNDRELAVSVYEELRSHLEIDGDPLFHEIHRYPDGMVQYEVGHGPLVEQIQHRVCLVGGLHLIGSSYRGVGIPDCVHEAEEEAQKVFNSFTGELKKS